MKKNLRKTLNQWRSCTGGNKSVDKEPPIHTEINVSQWRENSDEKFSYNWKLFADESLGSLEEKVPTNQNLLYLWTLSVDVQSENTANNWQETYTPKHLQLFDISVNGTHLTCKFPTYFLMLFLSRQIMFVGIVIASYSTRIQTRMKQWQCLVITEGDILCSA